jgi:hypothetical protein
MMLLYQWLTQTDTLYLNQKFKSILKDRLYYDQFSYCIGFHLREVNCLRRLDHNSIDQMINRRRIWRETAQTRWISSSRAHAGLLSRNWEEITDQTIAHLHELANILITTKKEFKLVLSSNQGYVYTNDRKLISKIDQFVPLTYKTYTQAKIDRPKNTIRVKNSQHRYRSYFKTLKLSSDKKTILVNFLQNQQINARCSPSLSEWSKGSFNRTQDYFFVDYSTESWLTMLSLVHPGLIRKTVQIVSAINS